MWKRRHITEKMCAESVQYANCTAFAQVVYRDESPVDSFYTEKTKASDDALESVSHVDPIILLFNQQRLDSLGDMGITAFLDSLQQRTDAVAELRKKCSDEELAKMIKSRYLQTPSEITAWCRYMDSNVEAFNQEMKQVLEEQNLSAELSNIEPNTSEL